MACHTQVSWPLLRCCGRAGDCLGKFPIEMKIKFQQASWYRELDMVARGKHCEVLNSFELNIFVGVPDLQALTSARRM
jgi:hypothetical protein